MELVYLAGSHRPKWTCHRILSYLWEKSGFSFNNLAMKFKHITVVVHGLRRGALKDFTCSSLLGALAAVGGLRAGLWLTQLTGDQVSLWGALLWDWSHLVWTEWDLFLSEEKGLGCSCKLVAQSSWLHWQEDRSSGAVNLCLALCGNATWVYVLHWLYPGRKRRQQEDTGRCLSSLAKNLHLPSGFSWLNFAWLQWGCTVMHLIYRVQSQTGCFLGLASPHPTCCSHEQKEVGA